MKMANYNQVFRQIFERYQYFLLACTGELLNITSQIPNELEHHSLVFRTSRTHLNSLENLAAFLGAAMLAILVGADATWTAGLIWTYALARLAHMILYYAIVTNKNPSPRSYFYLIGVVANLGLLGLIGFSLLN